MNVYRREPACSNHPSTYSHNATRSKPNQLLSAQLLNEPFCAEPAQRDQRGRTARVATKAGMYSESGSRSLAGRVSSNMRSRTKPASSCPPI